MNSNSLSRYENLCRINQTCNCVPLEQLGIDTSTRETSISNHPLAQTALFANTPVFISATDHAQIRAVAAAVYTLARLPAYRDRCQSRSHMSGSHWPEDKTSGLLSGFDFHLSPEGPQLIEVNTNAGGAFISQKMIAAHNAALYANSELSLRHPFGNAGTFADSLRDMVKAEWHYANRTSATPRHLAIVDDDPATQFLYADMKLARDLLQDNSMTVSIVDAEDLRYIAGKLLYNELPVDFVYNRLTDFEFASHPALLQAWQDDAVVISPSPLHHRLLADKRNMTIFSNTIQLRKLGLNEVSIDALKAVPETIELNDANASKLWDRRKGYYFKPISGYGSKAVYRGSKITRRVWGEIASGGHVAQRTVLPALRYNNHSGDLTTQKFDIRAFAYDGKPFALVARMYQGQTTNFRTPGGGFAPVAVLPDWACNSCH